MPEHTEIDYGVLIDHLIGSFPAVERLWPIRFRLSLWILLEAAILAVCLLLGGSPGSVAVLYSRVGGLGAALFILMSITAAWMALRNSIPGRESSNAELPLLTVGLLAAVCLVQFEPSAPLPPSLANFLSTLGRYLAFAALPWLALFWAARRAMPLQARLVGGLIGVAAACFAIVGELFTGAPDPIGWELLGGDPDGAVGNRRGVVAQSRATLAHRQGFIGRSDH